MIHAVRPPSARQVRAIALLISLLFSFARTDARGPSGYNLSASLEASSETANPGEQITLVLTATADDSGSADAADLTLTIPDGAGFVSASSGGVPVDGPEPGSAGVVHASPTGGVAAGASVELEVVVDVTADAGTSLLFEGRVDGPNGSAGDADTSDNETSAVVMVSTTGSADVAVEVFPLGDEAGSGSLYSYEVDVENVSDDDSVASGVAVTIPIPAGSTFASVESESDGCSMPEVGSGGSIVCVFEELGAADAVAIYVTVAVTARPGATLELSASVDTASTDPDDGNNEASDEVPVVPSPPVMLDWEEPDGESSAALPPPRDLVVLDDDDAPVARPSGAPAPRDTVVNYKVYGSPRPGVVPGPSGLLATIPATQTSATVPAAPAGTFYVVTATYASGESGPSNEASGLVPAATVTTVKIKGAKLTATGSAFTDQVQVLVDGVPFAAAAKVKKAGTKVVQKGSLLTGMSLSAYLASHPTVIVMFRNSNGGVAAYAYPH